MKYLTNILQSSNGKFKNASYLLPAGCMHNSSGYKIVKLLDAWWHPEGSYEIGSVHSSIPPTFSLGILLELDHFFQILLWH